MERPPEVAHDAPLPEEAAARRRLEKAGNKLLAIAIFSTFIPLAGALFALFALVAGISTRKRAAILELPHVARRAGWSMGVAIVSLGWQAFLTWTWLG